MSRVCVITGAASGIGRGMAERFLEASWSVVGFDVDSQRLRQTTDELKQRGDFKAIEGDVASPEDLARAADAAVTMGELQCWVNNAGYNIVGDVHELEQPAYERGVAVNLGGVFWGTSVAVRHFLAEETRGNVINISSVTALEGFGRLAA